MYRYIDNQVVAKTLEEIRTEIEALPKSDPQPTPNDYTNIALAEVVERQEQIYTNVQLAIAELAEMMIGGSMYNG